MNLPNKLTMLRVLLIPFFMVFMSLDNYLVAIIIFAFASFTDFLDGYIARKHNLVTDFGKFMDPLADKILTTTAIIYMVAQGLCHPVVLIIIMAREFAVSGVRMIAAEKNVVIAANIFGKIKTVLQMVVIIIVYSLLGAEQMGVQLGFYVNSFSHAFMWAVAVITLVSGVVYIVENRDCIKQTK